MPRTEGDDDARESASKPRSCGGVDRESHRRRPGRRRSGVWAAWWLAITVSAVVLGLLLLRLVPAVMAASLAVAREEAGPAIGSGVALALGLPALSIAVLFTLVGIPLGLFGLLSVALLYSLGYVVAALVLGRTVVKEPTSGYVAFLAGLGILRLLGLVPVVAGLAGFLASAYGLGALAIAGWRAARRPLTPVVAEPLRRAPRTVDA